jgi:hypothetical protein
MKSYPTQAAPEILDRIADVVLAHRPKAKQKKPRKRKRQRRGKKD